MNNNIKETSKKKEERIKKNNKKENNKMNNNNKKENNNNNKKNEKNNNKKKEKKRKKNNKNKNNNDNKLFKKIDEIIKNFKNNLKDEQEQEKIINILKEYNLNPNNNLKSEKLEVRIHPTNDLVFKNIFLTITNKKILINLLNEILSEYSESIEDIELINAEVIPEQLRLIVDDLEKSKLEIKDNENNDETTSNTNDKLKNKNNNKKENEKIYGKRGYMDGLIKNMTKDNGENEYKEDSDNKMLLRAKTKSNVINIEIQVLCKGDMFKRSLFYSSSNIMRSLRVETSYSGIPDVILINLLDYDMFDKHNPKYHWTYGLIERELKEEDEFCKMLNFHFIELKKFLNQINKSNNESNKDELIRKNPWLYFIKNPNDKYFRNAKTPYLFKNAREKLISLQRNPEFYFKYALREMELTDAISGLKEVGERNFKRGRIYGKIEGERKMGIYSTLIFLKKGSKIDQLKEYKLVSDDELVILNNILNGKNKNHDIGRLAINLNIEENILEDIFVSLDIPYIKKGKRRKLE